MHRGPDDTARLTPRDALVAMCVAASPWSHEALRAKARANGAQSDPACDPVVLARWLVALFSRQAAIEAACRVVEPVLNEHPSAIVYGPGPGPGHSGPAAANHFKGVDGGCDNPALPPKLPAVPA